ncbi:MAG: ATP12 family protein [Sphingomonadales bacterium]
MASFKRFYKDVSVAGADDAYSVLLDGRSVKTPAREELVLPTEVMAGLIAGEWKAQRGSVKPETMPLTRLASTALDTTTSNQGTVIAGLMAFAGHDLLCYRAEVPLVLRTAEEAAWDPYLDWLENAYLVRLVVTTGIATVAQEDAGLKTLRDMVGRMDVFALTALHNATTLSGSLVLGLALMKGFRSPEEIWAAAHVDEDYQIAEWGEDEENKAGRAAKADLWQAVADFIRALK